MSDQQRYRLLIEESMLIRQREPKLNGTGRSLPLYIYPDGLQKVENKKSNLCSKPSVNHIDAGGNDTSVTI